MNTYGLLYLIENHNILNEFRFSQHYDNTQKNFCAIKNPVATNNRSRTIERSEQINHENYIKFVPQKP